MLRRMDVEKIVDSLALSEEYKEIQRIQTEHRLKLAQFWGIEKGNKVLEIGCGQGDTTAVLSYLVGESGYVYGIDKASADYGGPLTLGEAIGILQKSSLGKPIQVEFDYDILANDVHFPENMFDCIVFSHCSWYLSSQQELVNLFKKVGSWGKKLCFAEWNPELLTLEQYPHLLAVLIQAQTEVFKEKSTANVRTVFTQENIQNAIIQSGWSLDKETVISSPLLQDGGWEVSQVLNDADEGLNLIKEMPDKMKQVLLMQISLLKKVKKEQTVKPLSTYAFTARSI
ncbi:class I SAM-dependent methyltransferase [Alkalihalobacillus sp. 1P02AB]|uniref:class I SAM-dependent methyltransferase n=1 Tax=Alkalihalobacillus sp. 1P02AB TaxID=3132260 RepID=UPI0039A5ACF4